MPKFKKIWIFLVAPSIFLFSGLVKSAESGCTLTKAPLVKDNYCDDFDKKDRDLDRIYVQLGKLLSREDKSVLIKTQRSWIQWRNEKYYEVQNEAHCGNSLCDGEAHDSCILNLTEMRASELSKYVQNKKAGIESGFGYSKENIYDQ